MFGSNIALTELYQFELSIFLNFLGEKVCPCLCSCVALLALIIASATPFIAMAWNNGTVKYELETNNTILCGNVNSRTFDQVTLRCSENGGHRFSVRVYSAQTSDIHYSYSDYSYNSVESMSCNAGPNQGNLYLWPNSEISGSVCVTNHGSEVANVTVCLFKGVSYYSCNDPSLPQPLLCYREVVQPNNTTCPFSGGTKNDPVKIESPDYYVFASITTTNISTTTYNLRITKVEPILSDDMYIGDFECVKGNSIDVPISSGVFTSDDYYIMCNTTIKSLLDSDITVTCRTKYAFFVVIFVIILLLGFFVIICVLVVFIYLHYVYRKRTPTQDQSGSREPLLNVADPNINAAV